MTWQNLAHFSLSWGFWLRLKLSSAAHILARATEAPALILTSFQGSSSLRRCDSMPWLEKAKPGCEVERPSECFR